MAEEVWKTAPGYEGLYIVSDHGRVWSVRRKCYLKPVVHRKGHLYVCLSQGTVRSRKWWGVHCLVLTTFVGPCPEGLEGCHWDDDPGNNYIGNLRWDTRSANSLDSVRNGTHYTAGKTHCKSGHEFTEANTYTNPNSGVRSCKTCHREIQNSYMARKRAGR